MITLEYDQLVFRFPEVHPRARSAIVFQRTLRIPDDGREYPLPPGLGTFPLRHLDDYAERLPENWLARGGVIMPMHQAEAMWIGFAEWRYPCAIKVATGKVCAITGETWVEHLNADPQDYVVVPGQPWVDGYCVEKGLIRQFVAMPLGDGYSVEEQITGEAKHGGLQIVVYPMKAERYEALFAKQYREFSDSRTIAESLGPEMRGDNLAFQKFGHGPSRGREMGLAPGGRMRQGITADHYGIDAWDQRHSSRCFVAITNSATWLAITGERPPTEPPTAAQYAEAGFPWFEYFDDDAKALAGAGRLKDLLSVSEYGKEEGGGAAAGEQER